MHRVRYIRLGSGLVAAGACILIASLFVLGSYPGVSTGIALLVLGVVILLLGTTTPGVPADLADLLVRVGYENLGRLLEEIGLQSRAVYLPSAVSSGGARTFIPLVDGTCTGIPPQPLDDRLVTFCGDGADDVGLLVSSPGSAALALLEYPPGETMDELSVALNQLAVSSLRVAEKVDLFEHDGMIEARFRRESVPAQWLSSSVEGCLGSLCGSIAAAVVAEGKGRGVVIESESVERGIRTVMLTMRTWERS